jgi:uncharacterized protein
MSDRLISADSHLHITHDQVKSHLDPAFHETYDAAAGAYEARMSKGTGAANRAGAELSAHDAEKAKADRAEQIASSNAVFGRKGYWDAEARLEDMDTDGVDVEVLYSEVSAFRYLANVDGAVGPAVQAFNDALAAFAQTDPKRLIVSYQIPIHDIDLAVAEVARVIALGGKSLQLPVFPTELGAPDYFDLRYEPLFSTIQDSGLPICFHIGLKTTLDELAERDPTPNKGIMVPVTPLMTAEAFGMLIMGGVFERFPRLKVVFVEPGLTWVAWWLDVVDDMVTRQGYKFPAITELPSTYFHRNISLTFIDERMGLHRMRDLLGVENLLWSTDFPHPVTSWPHSRQLVEEQFRGIPAEERDLMVCANAERIWNL